MRKKWISAVLAAALLSLPVVGVNLASAAQQYTGWAPAVDLAPLHPAGFAAKGIKGKYLAGDLHNHTPFSDGTPSVPLLVGKAMQNLDWFAQSGHGGAWSRDGRYNDPERDGSVSGEGKFLDETVGLGAFKGDLTKAGTRYNHQNMWRWQSIQAYLYPVTWKNSMYYQKPIWAAVEWNVPGHEHCSAGCIDGQFTTTPGQMGNADALAQFEYLFDMEDKDMSEGGGQHWTGKIPNPPKTPTADFPHPGVQGHAKAVAACQWMEKHHQLTSYLLFTHIERKGVWDQDKGGNNTGYNVEHFRDFNNAAPDVCFGWEGMPGHQAQVYVPGKEDRGEYVPASYGGGTYGGTGYYSATVGHMWDALLSEGRNWWLFGSSDFHSLRVSEYESSDGPNAAADGNNPEANIPIQNLNTINSGWRGARASKADFWPREYQKDYVFVKSVKKPTAQDVLNGMRGGNSFVVQGDLIRGLAFTARAAGPAAAMGEKLTVGPNQKVTVKIRVYVPRDPNNKSLYAKNNCPYDFSNPSLAQAPIGMQQPLNRPVLHHVDLICGQVTGKIKPDDPNYTNPRPLQKPTFKTLLFTAMKDEGNGWHSYSFVFTPTSSCYFRLRGTNLPPGTPHETDNQGNPLVDSEAHNITYTDPQLGPDTKVDGDVAAWSDLWFYSNPIFIQVGARPLSATIPAGKRQN
jgi:hypothetical protein